MIPFIPLIVLLTAAAVGGDPRPKTITVNITVRTEAGDPIENAPVMAFVQGPRVFGFTDDQGMLVLQAPVSEDSEEIIAVLYKGDNLLTHEDHTLATQRYWGLRDEYYFKDINSQPYTADVTEVDFEIIAFEAIRVTVTVTSPMPEWASDKVRISVRDGTWFNDFPPLEPFDVRGVRKGHPAELFFILYEENATRSITLTADQTKEDVNLGEIQFPEIDTGAIVDITVTNQEDLWEPGGTFPMWTRVTLISFDGQTILCYPINPKDGKVVDDLQTVQEKEPPNIPPDVYYISPGLFGNRTQLMLLDMVRAGAHELLGNAGVPVLAAKDGETTSLTINARDVRDAIIAAYELWKK